MFAVAETTPTQQPSQIEIPFPKNWEALTELQLEHERLNNGWGISMSASTTAEYLTNPIVAAGGLATGSHFQWRSEKVSRLLQTLQSLLATFESKGVEIYPRIPVEGMNPIDLFVRFPKKTHLFISIRSKGDTEIVYNESREILYVKRKNKRLSEWQPNPLIELADYKSWLDKHRGLFGMSSKEAQKTPTARVLALWHPTQVEQHRDELYSELGAVKTLVIRRKGTAFVIQQEVLLGFVQAWLAIYD
ncbi:MAG: hypothetical protein HC772_17510 [Leptolyngbyaceae cyanobacterium CRU_2_3]|nr:hypothetical protein [Leptolyngbyaceae cyanobacterium CRU_2_3]